MKIVIPKDNFKQENKGDQSGNLWATYNIDLESNEPKMRVSPTLITQTTSTDQATLATPIAFVRSVTGTSNTDYTFVVANQGILRRTTGSSLSTDFVADTFANSPTTQLSSSYSDATTLQGSVIVSGTFDLSRLSAGTWNNTFWTGTLLQSSLTIDVPHPLNVGFTNELLIGNGNVVASVDINNAADANRIVLPKEFETTWIRSSNSQYFIGARHKFGGTGKVFVWDGASETFNWDYEIGATISWACVIKDNIPYIFNGNGQLLAFTGAGFTEVARLPIANHKIAYATGTTVHRNGMALIDNQIHILINANISSPDVTVADSADLLENQLSGIWVYTPEHGLHHKYSISKANGVDNSSDYGSPKIISAGALFPLPTSNGKFLAGSQLYKADGGTDSTQIGVINYVDEDQVGKMGYFITPRIYGNEIEEMWQKVFATFSPLLNSGDFIKLSYRQSVDIIPTPVQRSTIGVATGLWSSATAFTVSRSYMGSVSVGDEVEILSGEGSGLSSHITAISNASGTYTVVIADDILAQLSGNMQFRAANWTKIDTVTDLVRAYKEFSVERNSNWIQFKGVLYGTGNTDSDKANSPELEKLIIKSENQIKVV